MTKTPGSTLAHRFLESALRNRDLPAIADSSGRSLTYAETQANALGYAAWLQDRPEQNVGIALPPCVPAALVNYGVTLAGKTAVNLNFTSGEENCRAAIEICGIRTVITSRLFASKAGLPAWPEMVFLEDIKPSRALTPEQVLASAITPDTPACILFSSGSTGVPKGVCLTHWNILTNADGCRDAVGLLPRDAMLGVLPFFHSFGYTFALWFPVLEGMRAIYHVSPLDAQAVGDLAYQHRATFLLSTPTFCGQYARKCAPDRFQSMRCILVGAEKLRDSIATQFRQHFGVELLAGYGCTETGPGVAVNTPHAEGKRAGSVGRPLPGITIRIADPETLEPLPVGSQGMVLVKGPSIMREYYRAPELTAQALRDGFYVTGDLGYVDEDGFLYITDRLARFSKIGGEMVPHLKIEETIAALTPSFVTGVPDARRGERLILLYTNPDVTAAQIHEALLDSNLPQLWIPKRESIHLVESIPVLPTGKTDLKRARELAGSLVSA